MTAEVGVLNRLGVALAADSAVTLGPAGKIYTSADKLFQLSENAPVGIMVYGSADLLEVPWETIIKIYRRQLGNTVFDKLKNYADDFLNFIQTTDLFSLKMQSEFIEINAATYFAYLFEKFENALKQRLENQELTDLEIQTILNEIVTNELMEIKNRNLTKDISKDYTAILRRKYAKLINSVKKRIFEKLPISQGTSNKLTTAFIESLLRGRLFENYSGIVIAGFGEKEHFASLFELRVLGIAANQPIYSWGAVAAIGEDVDACIIPFAQQEMVAGFMTGIDPSLQKLMQESTFGLFQDVADVILEQVKQQDQKMGPTLEKHLPQPLETLVQSLFERWRSAIHKFFSQPIMEIVASLPKDELAGIAESLVNLTKFKRRISKQQETVGGPIDVAIVSKGDGFVWIKRKHYFDPELNPRFIASYYRRLE